MMTILTSLVPSLIAFFIFLGVHIILWRASVRKRGVVLLVKIALVSYLAILLLLMLFESKGLILPEHYLLSSPFYLLLTILYLHFYVGMDRSVSIRVLGELVESPKDAMKLKEISSLYSPTSMLQPRLDGLKANHWLREKQGIYQCTRKGALLAKITLIVQKWYHLDQTG